MKFHHQFSLIFLFLTVLVSCSSYSELVFSSRINLPADVSDFKFSAGTKIQKPGVKTFKNTSIVIESKKYLARGKNFSPESEIMNAGISEALNGNYFEAEILFNEIRDCVSDGSVENNLAVIFEVTRRKKEAMIMYSQALFKSPDNPGFKSNLISFINNNYSLENR